MTDEERQRQMDFILNQQAALVSSQQKADERITRIENVMVRYYEDTSTRLNALIDAQIKTEENVAHLAAKMTELAESQTHTDKRLDALIDIVRQDRNGKS